MQLHEKLQSGWERAIAWCMTSDGFPLIKIRVALVKNLFCAANKLAKTTPHNERAA
jgi:hypothetical protein